MNFSDCSDRALEIHGLYAARAARAGVRAWTKEELMQGFVVDVGELMRLVMAKQGLRKPPDTEQALAHELSDCLWSVLVLARLYEIDLSAAFVQTMDDLECKLSGPLGPC